MNGEGPPYLGKFQGVVSRNEDPLHLGRVRARVPDVFGNEESGWALPAVPYAGKDVGFFMIPPVDANVWIEFEHGDPEYPIWTGCFWGEGEVPVDPAVPEMKVLKTEAVTITLNDKPGETGVRIETKAGMSIEIDNGQKAIIKLAGSTVSINGNALEVT